MISREKARALAYAIADAQFKPMVEAPKKQLRDIAIAAYKAQTPDGIDKVIEQLPKYLRPRESHEARLYLVVEGTGSEVEVRISLTDDERKSGMKFLLGDNYSNIVIALTLEDFTAAQALKKALRGFSNQHEGLVRELRHNIERTKGGITALKKAWPEAADIIDQVIGVASVRAGDAPEVPLSAVVSRHMGLLTHTPSEAAGEQKANGQREPVVIEQ